MCFLASRPQIAYGLEYFFGLDNKLSLHLHAALNFEVKYWPIFVLPDLTSVYKYALLRKRILIQYNNQGLQYHNNIYSTGMLTRAKWSYDKKEAELYKTKSRAQNCNSLVAKCIPANPPRVQKSGDV